MALQYRANSLSYLKVPMYQIAYSTLAWTLPSSRQDCNVQHIGYLGRVEHLSMQAIGDSPRGRVVEFATTTLPAVQANGGCSCTPCLHLPEPSDPLAITAIIQLGICVITIVHNLVGLCLI